MLRKGFYQASFVSEESLLKHLDEKHTFNKII